MKPINYSNTVMYKIVPKDLNSDLIYIGHTTNFRKRKSQHKENCNNLHYEKSNLKVYQMIRDNGGWDEWEMIEIEKFPCIDGNEARTRERQLMEKFNANLNIIKSIVSNEERKEKNRIRSQMRVNKNRNAINAKRREDNEKNREVFNAKALEYRKKNRDKINERQQKRRLEQKLKKALELENN